MSLGPLGSVAAYRAAGALGVARIDRADASAPVTPPQPAGPATIDRRTADEDAPSFDDVREWVRTALHELYPTAECGPWVCEIWTDHLIFELEAKLYRIGYALDLEAKTAAIVGTPLEVVRETSYVPVQPAIAAPAVGDSAAAVRRVRVDLVAPIHCDPARKDGILATPDPATGFLKLDGRLTRTGVFRYRDQAGNEWGELRTDDEVFAEEALDSFRSVVVTNDHPAEFVSRKNVRDVQVGHLGSDVRRDGAFVRASIVVTDAPTILDIQEGKCELSCGYTAECVADSGELDGQRYDLRQTAIRGNHVAIVDVGRAGPECALLAKSDGAGITVTPIMSAPARRDAATNTEKAMDPNKLIQDALAALKAKKVADAHKHMRAALDAIKASKAAKKDAAAETAQAAIDLLTKGLEMGDEMLLELVLEKTAAMLKGGEAPAETPEPPAADQRGVEEEPAVDAASASAPATDAADAVKLQAKLDALEAARKRDRDTEAARIDARVKLVADVRAICPSIDPTGKSDADLKRAVVLEVNPELKSKLDARAKGPRQAFEGYLDAAYEAALELHANRERHVDDQHLAVFGAHQTDGQGDLDTDYADFLKRRDERSRAVAKAS